MIVHHTDGLQEGIHDGAAHKAEASLYEVARDRIAERGARRRAAAPRPGDLRLSADEGPQVALEGAELALHREEGAGVGDGRLDLETVANDAGIAHQGGATAGIEARHA